MTRGENLCIFPDGGRGASATGSAVTMEDCLNPESRCLLFCIMAMLSCPFTLPRPGCFLESKPLSFFLRGDFSFVAGRGSGSSKLPVLSWENFLISCARRGAASASFCSIREDNCFTSSVEGCFTSSVKGFVGTEVGDTWEQEPKVVTARGLMGRFMLSVECCFVSSFLDIFCISSAWKSSIEGCFLKPLILSTWGSG